MSPVVIKPIPDWKERSIKKGIEKKRKGTIEEHLSLCNLIDPLDRFRRDRSTRPPISKSIYLWNDVMSGNHSARNDRDNEPLPVRKGDRPSGN